MTLRVGTGRTDFAIRVCQGAAHAGGGEREREKRSCGIALGS